MQEKKDKWKRSDCFISVCTYARAQIERGREERVSEISFWRSRSVLRNVQDLKVKLILNRKWFEKLLEINFKSHETKF